VLCCVVAGVDVIAYRVAGGDAAGSDHVRFTDPFPLSPPFTAVAVKPVTALGSRKLSWADD